MTLGLFWWSPTLDLKTAGSEAYYNHRAWLHNLRNGPKAIANFGDAVNPLIVESLTGLTSHRAAMRDADLVSIGSILNSYVKRGSSALVLGSGLRDATGVQAGVVPEQKVLLLRGSLSAEALGIPYAKRGDPGLVVRYVVKQRRPRGIHPVVIPHFSVPNSRLGRLQLSALSALGARIVYPNETPAEVALAISGAAYVLTSSLHGMVFADSLGIPVQLTSFGTQAVREPLFKYDDYQSVYGLTSHWTDPAKAIAYVQEGLGLTEAMEERSATVQTYVDDVITGISESARPLRSN